MIQSNDTWDCTRAYQSSVFWRDPFLTRAMENRFNYRLGRVVWVGNRWPKKIYLTDCWPAGNTYIRIFIVHTDPPSCVRDTSATKVRTISRTARNGKIKEEKVWNKDLRMEDGSRSRDRKNRAGSNRASNDRSTEIVAGEKKGRCAPMRQDLRWLNRATAIRRAREEDG